MTLAAKRAALPFTETAPHAVRDPQPHRELEALALDRANRADGLRVAHRLAAGRKEIDLTRVVQAFGLLLPRRREIGIGHRLARSHLGLETRRIRAIVRRGRCGEEEDKGVTCLLISALEIHRPP